MEGFVIEEESEHERIPKHPVTDERVETTAEDIVEDKQELVANSKRTRICGSKRTRLHQISHQSKIRTSRLRNKR